MERVGITKLKLPEATGVWGAYLVGEDEFGTWFFTPGGSPIVWTNLSGKADAWEFDVLCLIPRDDWWFALWWGAPDRPVELSVDVTAVAHREGNHWSWLDLEIDLFRLRDGTVGVEDEDEFEASCAAGYISAVEQAEALRVTPIIEQLLRDRVEPFGEVGPRYLYEAAALALAPLEPPG